MSSSKYLIAYNSVAQDSNMYNNNTRNVYVAVVDKSSKAITQRQFTYYDEGSDDTSTPHMVNIGGSYLILWNERNQIYCNKITASGAKVDDATVALVGGAQLCHGQAVGDQEGQAAELGDHDGETPDVAHADGGADAGENKAPSALKTVAGLESMIAHV